MQRMLIVLMLIAAGLIAVTPTQAQAMDDCSHTATIAALHECVQHATEHGFIDQPGIAASLHAKLEAAAAAENRNQAAVAINVLEAFTRELDAQSGTHVTAQHAAHLRLHAELVIAALNG